MHLFGALQNFREEQGAIGWLIVGIILGVILVIWVIARIIGAIF